MSFLCPRAGEMALGRKRLEKSQGVSFEFHATTISGCCHGDFPPFVVTRERVRTSWLFVSTSAIIEGCSQRKSLESLIHSPRPSSISVDPRGAHPTSVSILGVPGEVSVHHVPYHVPSRPMVRAPRGHAERSARMKRFSYGERDYAFGQAMLTLRTSIGLTQAGLAERLRVTRKAISRWEAGDTYPKASHLQALLAFAV